MIEIIAIIISGISIFLLILLWQFSRILRDQRKLIRYQDILLEIGQRQCRAQEVQHEWLIDSYREQFEKRVKAEQRVKDLEAIMEITQ